MRHQIIHAMLATLLLQTALPHAWAQSGENQSTNDRPAAERVAARNPNPDQGESPRGWGEPQRGRGCERCRYPHPMPRRRYPERYPDDEDPRYLYPRTHRGRHALIGAIIGFGIGAALGAKANKDQHTQARVGAPLLFGAVGALIGAAVGANHP